MRPLRLQYTLRTLLALLTSAAVVVWWWLPGSGVQCHYRLGNDAGYFPKVERLRSVEDDIAHEEQTPVFGPVPRARYHGPLDHVDFTHQDLLIVPRPFHAPNLTAHPRLGGHLVVFRAEQPDNGDQGQELIIPKQAAVRFWPGVRLLVCDVTVTALGLLPVCVVMFVRRRSRHQPGRSLAKQTDES